MLPPQPRPGPSAAFSTWKPGGVPGLAGLSLLALVLPCTLFLPPVRAGEITPTTGSRGLGSLVNGSSGSCTSGSCAITGGTASGRNLFHRFAAFDTRNGISGVSIDTTGKPNVIMGVTSAAGTFIDTSVQLLNGRSNLFWLSPGGIRIGNGGGFVNASQLTLSTATGLRISTPAGIGSFDAVDTTATALSALSGDPVPGSAGLLTERATLDQIGITNNGDLSLDGGLLTVDSSLLLDAQGGNVLLQGTSSMTISTPGGSAVIAGASATGTGSLTIDGGSLSVDTPFTLEGPQAVLTGSADLEMNRAFTWKGGATIDGTGTLITNGETTLSGPAPLRIGRSWINNSSVRFAEAASVEFLLPSRLTNNFTGEILFDGAATDPLPAVSGPVLIFNAGKLLKTAATSQRLDILGLQNPGVLDVNAGSLFLNTSLTLQTGSINLANDASLFVRSDPFFNQGRITGTGTLVLGASRTGTLVNLGTIAPGGEGTAGTLTIDGNFRQQERGSLLIDLGGPAPGDSDRLAVTGTAELGGTLTTGLIGGYNPVAGDSFEVIIAGGGISGAFTTQNLPPDFKVDPTGSIYRLVSVAQPPVPPPQPPIEPPQKPPITPQPPDNPNPPDNKPAQKPKRRPSFASSKPVNAQLSLAFPSIQIQLLDPRLNLGKDLPQLEWSSRDSSLDPDLSKSFSSTGKTPASGAAANRPAGSPATVSTEKARANFVTGESQAQRDTAAKLGITQSVGGPAPTPERLQCLLREAAEWVRSGRNPAQGRAEEDPCRS